MRASPLPILGKLVLLSERDPKAFEVPLVGLWVSGVDELLEAYAWAACARYASLPPSTASTVTVRVAGTRGARGGAEDAASLPASWLH